MPDAAPRSGAAETGRGALVPAALVLITLIWGTTWAAIRVGLEGVPPLFGVSLRFLIAGLVLLALAPLLRVSPGVSRRELGLVLLNAVAAYGVPYVAIYEAERTISSGLAAVLFATYPLFVALLAHVVLPAERLTRWRLGGAVVGFTGVAVLFSEDFAGLFGPGAGRAALLALLAPLTAAVSSVFVKRYGEGVSAFSLTALPMTLTGALLLPAAFAVEGPGAVSLDARSTAALLYLALLGTAVTFLVYFWLLSRLPASRLALVAYMTPVVAVITGALAFGEPLTARTTGGALLVILGVVLATARRARRVPRGGSVPAA